MNNIDWQAVATFEAVARLGTFTLAADELKVLQPSVSRRIAKLENELGVHLMRRTRPRVTLTYAGETLLKTSQSTIHQMSETLAAIKQRPRQSPLIINTTIGFASNFLLPRLNTFNNLYPDVSIELISRDVNDGYEMENFDLITVFGTADKIPGVSSQLICQEKMIAVASPAYRQQHQQSFGEPDSHRLLHLVSGNYADDWSIYFAGTDYQVPAPSTNQKFTSYMVYLHAALNGQGIALGPQFMLQQYLDSGELVKANSRSVSTHRGYYACLTRRGARHQPAVNFANWLVGLFT
ncbi:MAG: LysR family glycine cleavage system transcriptional activator [Gammaproteobacteria bacterium]|jgi:LysR family glycine cleavage system transcriptional activator